MIDTFGAEEVKQCLGPTFLEWLEAVTPHWQWRWRWQQCVRQHLKKIARGEIDRLIIELPVRHGKSEMVTVRYTAWRFEQNPRLKAIIGGYNQTVANRFSRKIRRIVRRRDGIRLNPRREAVSEWETLRGGSLRAAGVGGGVTSYGGNLIIVDDPIKSREEADSPAYRQRIWDWWHDDLWTRREPGAAVILIMSRWHRRDLAGRLQSEDEDGKWATISAPAIAGDNDPLSRHPGEALCPERYDEAALADIRATITERAWWSLYQQSPRAGSGQVFSEDWWEPRGVRFEPRDLSPGIVGRYISLDTAEGDSGENAYTAAVIGEMRRNRMLDIVHVWRERVKFPELPDEVDALARRWNQDRNLKGVIIEYKSSGVQTYQTLMATGPNWLQEIISPWTPEGSKEMRAEQAAVWCRNGMVRLPWPGPAWLEAFTEELYDFPASAFRDQVDAFSQLVIYLEHYIEEGWRERTG